MIEKLQPEIMYRARKIRRKHPHEIDRFAKIARAIIQNGGDCNTNKFSCDYCFMNHRYGREYLCGYSKSLLRHYVNTAAEYHAMKAEAARYFLSLITMEDRDPFL